MSYEDLQTLKLDEKVAKRQAKLETLMKICEAREQGIIRARNILKMDEKVNKSVRKIIKQSNPKIFHKTLPETIQENSLGYNNLRRLPPVKFTQNV